MRERNFVDKIFSKWAQSDRTVRLATTFYGVDKTSFDDSTRRD